MFLGGIPDFKPSQITLTYSHMRVLEQHEVDMLISIYYIVTAMSLITEYISRKLDISGLEQELITLIKKYNQKTGRYLFLYCGAISKNVPAVTLNMDDYYIIYDMLNKASAEKLDFYIETPGGSAEAAEEIVRFLRSKFKEVSFIISGEAKSAGTIMSLSGDEIKMTKSGSLGPIDAQMMIGRSFMSAYDYMEWINEKREEAIKNKRLNPFDATMIAQISPGELNGVNNALNFAKDLVKAWLTDYKFKNWNITETKKKTVTEVRKRKTAEEIVNQLVNHTKWRSHGRSIKIEDLEKLGLKITRIDDDAILSDIVYRIQAVVKLIFSSSTAYKYYSTEEGKIVSSAIQAMPSQITPTNANSIELDFQCQKCAKKHKIYAKLEPDPKIDDIYRQKGYKKFPKDNKFKCDCGFEHDLSAIKNQVEVQSKRKIVD